MAELSKDPRGWELEDFIAAHFVSRGCYVETGVKEKNPVEILELDIVWTDYREEPQIRHPVEVKSGDWGLGDVFKFFGWTNYLNLEPGLFVYKVLNLRPDQTIKHIEERTRIRMLHVTKPEDAEIHFRSLGLPDPSWVDLPKIWQYSFWAQRRLLQSLGKAIGQGVCIESAKSAKEYHQLINNAIFFLPDIQSRIGALLSAHFEHKELAATAAYEIETGKVVFRDPPRTKTFQIAYFQGKHFPVQSCLYLAHRARLYVLKAVIDFWTALKRGEIEKTIIKIGEHEIDLTASELTSAISSGMNYLCTAKSFQMFPIFWQVFLWSWGGFLLKDRLDEEYACLSKETGVPVDEIPIALSAFDNLFPIPGGWFREPANDSRKVLILMPAAMRGIGAFRRRLYKGLEHYKDLGYKDETTNRMTEDHNTGARLLDCPDDQLAK